MNPVQECNIQIAEYKVAHLVLFLPNQIQDNFSYLLSSVTTGTSDKK